MIVTLLTDFGAGDYFVGAVKGVLLTICPGATIVDITHEIPAHDVEAGAFTLLAAYDSFPPGTIHVAVVDPGVGSSRRPLLVVTADYFFVGPDNGLFSYILERESATRVFHLTNQEYFRPSVSLTFHGRDIFAPVAGALAGGVAPENLGERIEDFIRLEPLAPLRQADGALQARIIHIDHFGNCVTSLTRGELPDEMIAGDGVRLEVNGHAINSFRPYFAAADDNGADELFALWGSAGFLEIAAYRASAAVRLGVHTGQLVIADCGLRIAD